MWEKIAGLDELVRPCYKGFRETFVEGSDSYQGKVW